MIATRVLFSLGALWAGSAYGFCAGTLMPAIHLIYTDAACFLGFIPPNSWLNGKGYRHGDIVRLLAYLARNDGLKFLIVVTGRGAATIR